MTSSVSLSKTVPNASVLTRPRLYAVGRADSGSGIHQPGYKIAASSLGFCEAKLRSFPPTAKSGLGQVAKGVPVGLRLLKWTPYPCGDVVPQNPLRGIRIHCVGFDPTMPSEKKIFNLVSLKGWT